MSGDAGDSNSSGEVICCDCNCGLCCWNTSAGDCKICGGVSWSSSPGDCKICGGVSWSSSAGDCKFCGVSWNSGMGDISVSCVGDCKFSEDFCIDDCCGDCNSCEGVQ